MGATSKFAAYGCINYLNEAGTKTRAGQLGPRRNRILIWIGVTFCLVAIAILLWQPVRLFHWNDFRIGNEVISRVDAFRKNHGYVPESLKDVGITDPDLRVFYQKTDDNEYIVWFGTTLGESETYNSRSKKWE
jgi:hypothetical protein